MSWGALDAIHLATAISIADDLGVLLSSAATTGRPVLPREPACAS